MSLESLALLPELQKLPTDDTAPDLDFEGQLIRVVDMDRDHWSIEASAGVEASLKGLFDWRNVPDAIKDQLIEAHSRSFPNADMPVHEHYAHLRDLGPESVRGFLSNLKGKVGELRTKSWLDENHPEYNWYLASSPTQRDWDILGVGPDGTKFPIQVKTVAASRAADTIERMEDSPATGFAVSREASDRIAQLRPDLSERLIDTGLEHSQVTESTEQGIATLAGNFGLDVPDSVGDMLSYVGEVVLGIRFIFDLISVERDFSAVNLNDRSRVHAMKGLGPDLQIRHQHRVCEARGRSRIHRCPWAWNGGWCCRWGRSSVLPKPPPQATHAQSGHADCRRG